MHLTTKLRHPTFNHSEVIVSTNRQNDKLPKNRHHRKHPLPFTTLRRCVITQVFAIDRTRHLSSLLTHECSQYSDVWITYNVQQLFAVRPSAVVSPKTLTVYRDELAEFSCETTGSPNPRIEWIKDGSTLPERHNIRAGVLR